MQLIGNALNGHYFAEVIRFAASKDLEFIRAAVAYTSKADALIDLAKQRSVPLSLYTLLDGDRFPSVSAIDRFVNKTGPSIQLFITRNFFHPKIYWFGGVGVYIGSANLSDSGWNSNLECGVWFDAEDIEESQLDVELERMFAVVAARCVPASAEHIALVREMKAEQKQFAIERAAFDAVAARVLESLPGQHSPLDQTKTSAAKQQFINEWEAALTSLRKLVELARTCPSPSWVSASTHPAFIQDQATEHWYHHNVRDIGQDQIEILHRRNRGRIDASLGEVFRDWAVLDDVGLWAFWVNEAPEMVRERLTPEKLRNLGEEDIVVIVSNSHAMRETARHIRKATLKLPQNEESSIEERLTRFARLLAESRNDAGRTLGDVLEYVIWGDKQTARCAERIWNALNDSAWRFRFIGEHTLSELVGYARPDEYPPRNNRVRKSLRALGFDHAG